MVTKKIIEKKEVKEVKKTVARKPRTATKRKTKVAEPDMVSAPEPVKAENFIQVEEKIRPAGGSSGYLFTIGRRKEANARIRFMENGHGKVAVNGRDLKQYFGTAILREMVSAPLKLTNEEGNHDVEAKVVGGGIQGQAEAIRHGIARALVKWNPDFRPALKQAGFLKRDPRSKERKKFGHKKARRSPQWSKR